VHFVGSYYIAFLPCVANYPFSYNNNAHTL